MLIAMMGTMIWCTTSFYPRYSQQGGNATLAWDGAGYYWYLPSVFIYHDLGKQAWADSLIRIYNPGPDNVEGFGFRVENGNVVMKYPAGMALAELPFFFAAHALAKPLGFPADGFSKPYQVAIQFGALLVAFLGLWLLRKLLLIYYKDWVVAVCLFALVIGSNYLNYSSIDGSITHSWLFTLYVGLMLCSRSFYSRPSFGKAAVIGLLCGLATLIRPTEIITLLIPVLWGINSISYSAIRERMLFFKSQLSKLILAGIIGGGIILIQLLYWKTVAGHWLVYSYQDQGFSWLHPHVLDYALSYRSGWITYTPLMLLAVFGFIPFVRHGSNRVMIVMVSVIAFYIVSAWDIWWYAGMGGRAMIQYYPLLMFPMASLFEWIGQRRIRGIVLWPFFLLFVYINVWFTYNAHGGSLYDSEGGMSQEYYWRVIGRLSAPYETQKLKDGKYLYEHPMPASARLAYSNTLHQPSPTGVDSVLTMGGNTLNSAEYTFPFVRKSGEKWIRAVATFRCTEREGTSWNMTQFILGVREGKELVRETMIRVQRFINGGETKTLYVDLKLPTSRSIDSINVHLWNVESRKKIEVEGLRVYAF